MRVLSPSRPVDQSGLRSLIIFVSALFCIGSLSPASAGSMNAYRNGGKPSPTARAFHVGPFTFYGRSQATESDWVSKPRFPPELLPTAVTEGYAVAAWTVQPDGRVDDALVIEANDRAFGESVLRALPRRLLPQRDPAAMPRFETTRFLFKRKHAVVNASAFDYMAAQMAPDRHEERRIRTVQTNELDEEMTLIGTSQSDADVLRTNMPEGAVTIRFYIDQTGVVRVPAVMAASSSQSAMAALAAVRQWRFSPPTVDGNPVQVEAIRTIRLGPLSRTAQAPAETLDYR